jgi:hypothetical protein
MGDILSIYRTPASIGRDQHRGEFEACPACGESFTVEKTVCEYCGGDKFDDVPTIRPGHPERHIAMRCATRSCPGPVAASAPSHAHGSGRWAARARPPGQ